MAYHPGGLPCCPAPWLTDRRTAAPNVQLLAVRNQAVVDDTSGVQLVSRKAYATGVSHVSALLSDLPSQSTTAGGGSASQSVSQDASRKKRNAFLKTVNTQSNK